MSNKPNNPQDNVPQSVKSVQINSVSDAAKVYDSIMQSNIQKVSIPVLDKVLLYMKRLTASIVWEDSHDYSKGVKGAEVDYIPETVEELASELNLEISNSLISDKNVDVITRMAENYKLAQSRIEELEDALLKVRDRHIKNPITYNIITKALNNEK